MDCIHHDTELMQHNRQLIDIAVAAKRWRDAQRRRLEAGRFKRHAQEASTQDGPSTIRAYR